MENKKIFIDANIFLDYFNNERHDNLNATQFFKKINTQDNIQIYTSCDIVTNIYYFLAKANKNNALQAIDNINKICKIVEFGNTEVASAIDLMQSDADYFDLENTIQYILAKKEKCEMIVSNDKNFTSKDMKVLSSADFVKLN